MGQSNEKPADASAPAPTPSEGGDGGSVSGSGAALEKKPSTPIATFSAAPQSATARKQEKEPFRREGADLWIHVRRDEGMAPEAKAGVLLQGVERVRVTGEGDIELDGVVDWGCVRCLQITSPGYVVFGRHVADLNALEILEVSAKVVALDKQPFPLPSLHTLTLRGVAQLSYCAAASASSSAAAASAASAQDRCGHTHLVCPVLCVLSLPGVSAAAQRQLCFALMGSVLGASSAMPAVPDSASRRSTSDALTEDRLGPAGLQGVTRSYHDAAPSREVGSGSGSGGGGGSGGGVAPAGLGSVGVAAPAPPGRVASFLRPLPEGEECRNVSPVRQWSLQALPPDPAGRGGRRQSDVLNVSRLR